MHQKRKEPEYGYQYKKPKKSKRVEGDALWYFLLHNVYSALIFGMTGVIVGIFEYQFWNWIDIFTKVFLDVFLFVFFLMITCSFIGRGLAYITLKIIFNFQRKSGEDKVMKKIGELNIGINKILCWSYIFTTLLSASIFTLGIFPILQLRIFGINTFTTVVWTYLIVKISIFGIVRLFSNFKM